MSIATLPRNHSVARTERGKWTGCLPPTNDERRAAWAARFYAGGHHRKQNKPRVRVR